MQSCYPHIIDTRYMTTHVFGNQLCLLCHRNVRCASTDHTNEPTSASSHIVWPGNNYCLRVFTDTESVTLKCLTQYLYNPWLDATNNRPSRGRQKAPRHRNDLPRLFCLPQNDFRDTFALFTFGICTYIDYR